MIGQKKNLEKVKLMGFIPLIIINGDDMMGKFTLAREICKTIDPELKIIEIKKGIENVRAAINIDQNDKAFCIIRNLEEYRLEAQNALLKTFEESKNLCFIATVENMQNLIETIKTRAQIINIEPYSKDEIKNDLLISPSEIEYWKGRRDTVEEYSKKIEEFTNLFISENLIFSLGELKNLVSYKKGDEENIKEEDIKNPYIRFFLRYFDRFFNKKIHWKEPVDFKIAMEYRGEMFEQMKYPQIDKDRLLERYLRNLKELV